MDKAKFRKFYNKSKFYGASRTQLSQNELDCLELAKSLNLVQDYYPYCGWRDSDPYGEICDSSQYRLKPGTVYEDIYSLPQPASYNVQWDGGVPEIVYPGKKASQSSNETVHFSHGVPVFGYGVDEMQIIASCGCGWQQSGWCPWYHDESGRPYKVKTVKAIPSRSIS